MRWRKSSGSSGARSYFSRSGTGGGAARFAQTASRADETAGFGLRVRLALDGSRHRSVDWRSNITMGFSRPPGGMSLNLQFLINRGRRFQPYRVRASAMPRRSVWTLARGGPIEGHGFGPFPPPDDCARRRLRGGAADAACGIRAGRRSPLRPAHSPCCARTTPTAPVSRPSTICPAPRSAPPWGMASPVRCRRTSRRQRRAAVADRGACPGQRLGAAAIALTDIQRRAARRSPDLRQV